MEGVDYRGVPVIADVRAVPDSPWYLVTKLDASEAFALPRERMWVVIALVVALLAGAGAVVGRIWRQQSARFHRKERWAEERLRLQGAALDAAANAMVITDREGAIQWVNPAFTQMTGYALGEAVGRNPRDLVKSGQHDQAFFKNLWDTILAGGVWHGEMINRRKDGSLYTEEQTITPVRDERREIGHFISIKQDVTEQRRLEAQLRQAQRMEAIGQFAGGIAHDFNNQIFVMNGYCDFLLAEAAEQPALVGPLAEVKKAAQRAADLTAKILAFSRKQVLQPKVLDLNVELVDSEALLRRLIGADVRLTFRVGEDVGHVKVDPVQLQQVMMNLAANARDAMPQGGQLTIETANVVLDETYTRSRLDVTPGHYVLLALSDTGHGMDRETQARLFEPFFTTKDPGKGTGLGLASVYGIVKQSGGHVSVYSEIGRGTTFKIFLPWVDEPVETSRHRVVEQPAHGWETILLAEDEAAVRELVCRVLAAHGYRVLPAADGREALQLAERCDGPIHLLLTDVVMPGMSGSQLAERLAAVHPETRVIYMSGYAEDAVTRHGALTLGLAFLPKPCSTDLLVRKVREILDAPPRESLRGRRVLVVDDSEDERLLEARVISKAGGVAIGASGGAEALAVLEREAVDAVVTDVNMPSMDGFALTAAIRRSPPWQRLPVIILSGLYTEDEEARARAVGATACVSKGATDRQALLDILVEVIAAAEDRAAPLPRP
ncbi:MAG: response regulator [Candidatus Binatia bacterium]